MSDLALPSKLGKEPLIDVIFEIRFGSSMLGSSVLPGLLFSKLEGVSKIEPLPISQLPAQMREMDSNFHFLPLSKLTWGAFSILVGDKSLGVGCTMPYPGWRAFKGAIEQVVAVLNEAKIISSVDRYSIKYVDFFETGDDSARALSHFDIDLRIGTHTVKAENSIIRVEIPKPPFLHAVQIVTNASLQIAMGTAKSGAILDVDTLALNGSKNIADFLANLPTILHDIHLANKQVFFECLSENGLSNLEPQYE